MSRIRSRVGAAAESGSQAVGELGGGGEWSVLFRERGFAIVQDAAHAGTRWAADLGVGERWRERK